MKQENKEKTGHCILTYRVRLYNRHYDWLQQTKTLYTKVTAHFFEVLTKERELLALSDFLLLRALEERCIGTKEMKAKGVTVPYPMMGFPKIPLYFRRSAINAAITLMRQCTFYSPWSEEGDSIDSDNNNQTKKGVYETICVNCPLTLYKGMYQNFMETSIELKLFTGETWRWVKYPFSGRIFPKEAKKMSPFLVLKSNEAWLNVPLSFEVSDIRTVKERMEQEEYICAVSFPDYHVMAAAVILSKNGEKVEQQLFLGGKQKEHQRKRILKQIQQSQKSRGAKKQKKQEIKAETEDGKETVSLQCMENTNLYQKLHKINSYYAQSISRQIVEYCMEREIKIIVVPNYEEAIDFSNKRYMSTDNYRWLGRSIIKKLKYKAFQQGIVVTSVRPCHISDTCSECGSKIRKYNEGHAASHKYFGGKLFICPNGHKGNTAYNTAKNIGKIFLTYWT